MNEILNEVKFWKGIEKEYWKAVELLIREQRLKEIEIKTCRAGLTCFTGDLVILKMKELADFCKSNIPVTNENVSNESVIIENKKTKQNHPNKKNRISKNK